MKRFLPARGELRSRIGSARGRRMGWGLLDQALSSLTNFGLGILVAHFVSAREFGAFTLVFAVYGLLLGVSEGLGSVPLTIRFSAVKGDLWRVAERESMGTMLVAGVVSGVACVAVSAALGPALRGPVLALGVTLPGLLLQDGWRFAFMAEGRPALATANDALWAVLQFVGIVGVVVAGKTTASWLLLVWGGSATVAGIVGCLQAHALPAVSAVGRWLRDHRELAPRYALENLTHRAGPYLWLFAVGSITGLEAVAGLRGALLVLSGPLNPLIVGASFVAVPEGVRLYEESPERLPAAARFLSIAVSAVAAVWCVLALSLAGWFGPKLLGSTWPHAKPLFLILALDVVFVTAAVGPSQGVWVLAAARRSLRVQIWNVLLGLVATAAGAALDGARGAAIAASVTAAVITLLWRHEFRVAYAEARKSASRPPVVPAPDVA